MNKGHSGRMRTARSAENIESVWQQLAQHPRVTSARPNGVGLSPAFFNRTCDFFCGVKARPDEEQREAKYQTCRISGLTFVKLSEAFLLART